MIQLSDHFRRDNRSRHSEWLRQQRWFIKARRDQERREDFAEKLDNDFLSLATEAVMATDIQIEEFQARLDIYDEATVTALMENQEKLDTLYVLRDAMLAKAYVMEDGRRIFKSEDGSFAIDEFGKDVSRDEVDFDLIPDGNTTAEAFLANEDAVAQAKQERQRIYDYQEKLDVAREKIADGEIPEAELEELDAELAATMPQSVKAHVPGHDNNDTVSPLKTDFAEKASHAIRHTAATPAPQLDPMQ